MSGRLIHYAAEPVVFDPAYEYHRGQGACKPRGFWFSVEGEDDWAWWCRAEGFNVDRLAAPHVVALKPAANILRLCCASDIDRFSAQYGGRDRYTSRTIDWSLVAVDYDGLIIAPYIWSRRLDGAADWYYGWDCASGVVWNLDAIESVSASAVGVIP